MPDDRLFHRRAGHSQKVNLLTDLEFRVWFQYELSADDFGVMRGTHHPLQNDNDHLASRPAKLIQRCLDTLVKIGLIRRFEHQGKPYVYQHDWQTWQKVSYPRTATQPAPEGEYLAACDEPTRRLFALHPGGSGKKRGTITETFDEDSENSPVGVPESSALMRASAPAKRLTANGVRLPANGSEGGPGGTDPPMDVWIREVQAAYPSHRVTRGARTEHAFVSAMNGASDGPAAAYRRLSANLAVNVASHEWRVKGYVPKLENYLVSGTWENVLPSTAAPSGESQADDRGHLPPCRSFTECTARTLAEARHAKAVAS